MPSVAEPHEHGKDREADNRFVQLHWMDRYAKWSAADRGGVWIREPDRPWRAGWSTVVVTCHEATDASDRLAQRNRGCADVGRSPERQRSVPPEKPCGCDEATDESAVKVSGAREQR